MFSQYIRTSNVAGLWRKEQLLCGLKWLKLQSRLLQVQRCSSSSSDERAEDLLQQAAAEGDVSKLQKVINGQQQTAGSGIDVNYRTQKGWTALMTSVRHGRLAAAEFLLENNADTRLKTRAGHTAIEIAQFWREKSCYELLKSALNDEPANSQLTNFFDHSPLNRSAHRRGNDSYILQAMMDPQATFIAFYKSHPVVIPKKKDSRKNVLFKGNFEKVHQYLEAGGQNLVFLGVVEDDRGETPWFAIDITSGVKNESELSATLGPEAYMCHIYPGAFTLGPEEAAVCAHARGLFDWHFRFQFCSSCGSETKLQDSGYKRVCQNLDCLSHRGIYNTQYPRVDPTAITAVVAPTNEHLLLARKASFPPGMFTCIAGFVEPGESVESASRREVLEEVGVNVSRVDYHSSQPWPNPSILMLGCIAHATEMATIKMDATELSEARWFTRDEVVLMLTQQHPERWFTPPKQAIAHMLIKTWLLQSTF